MKANTLNRAVLDFLEQRYPASYTTREIAIRTGNKEKDVEGALHDLAHVSAYEAAIRRLHPCVTGIRDAIDNEVIWRCSDHYHKHANEPAEKPEDTRKPEDTTAALERDVGHAILLLHGLGFKVEVE